MHRKILLTLLFLIPLSSPLQGFDVRYSASLLLWEANEEGLDLAVDNKIGVSSITDGNMEYPPCNWGGGFRLGAESYIPCWEMDGEIVWTRFSSCSAWSKTASEAGGLFSPWTNPCASITAATKGKAQWEVLLNLVHLELSQTYCPSCCFDLKPHFGLVAGFLDQRLNLNFKGGVSKANPVIVLDDAIRMDNDYRGFGLRGGFNGYWYLQNDLWVYGKCAAAVLYGCFDLHQKETVDFEGVNDPAVALNLRDSFRRTKVFTELGLGIGKTWGCFVLEFGWDYLFFIGQNQLRRFVSLTDPGISVATNGDLTFQGFTLKGNYSF